MKKLLGKFYKNTEKAISKSGFGKFKIVQKGGRLIRSNLKSDFVEIDGHKMYLDPLDSLKLSINKSYEEFETELVKRTIKEGNVVVDIGANIGYFTLIFAKLVGKNGSVFAFEPELNNFNILKKNIEINNYANVKLVKKAISDKTKIMRLFLNDSNKGSHTLGKQKNNKQSTEIESVRLDDFFDINNKIDFIKIDIEGAEIDAINGMSKILQNNKDLKILIEYNPLMLKGFGITSQKFFTTLRELNFNIYDLDDQNKKLIHIKSADDLEKYKDGSWTNLLCSKNEEFLGVES